MGRCSVRWRRIRTTEARARSKAVGLGCRSVRATRHRRPLGAVRGRGKGTGQGDGVLGSRGKGTGQGDRARGRSPWFDSSERGKGTESLVRFLWGKGTEFLVLGQGDGVLGSIPPSKGTGARGRSPWFRARGQSSWARGRGKGTESLVRFLQARGQSSWARGRLSKGTASKGTESLVRVLGSSKAFKSLFRARGQSPWFSEQGDGVLGSSPWFQQGEGGLAPPGDETESLPRAALRTHQRAVRLPSNVRSPPTPRPLLLRLACRTTAATS